MSEKIEGGCRCGAIRYRLKLDKLPSAYACHCLDCQTWSGSAFSTQLIVPEDKLEISGTPALFELVTPGGERTSYQRACATCFTRIYNTNSARPGFVVMRAGTLDRSNELQIVAHIWAKRKLAGIEIAQYAQKWTEGASPAEFMAALSRERPV